MLWWRSSGRFGLCPVWQSKRNNMKRQMCISTTWLIPKIALRKWNQTLGAEVFVMPPLKSLQWVLRAVRQVMEYSFTGVLVTECVQNEIIFLQSMYSNLYMYLVLYIQPASNVLFITTYLFRYFSCKKSIPSLRHIPTTNNLGTFFAEWQYFLE